MQQPPVWRGRSGGDVAIAGHTGVEEPGGDPLVETVFHRFDIHWSPYGARVASNVIAERIREYPWFEALELQSGRAHIAVAEPRFVVAQGRTAWRLIRDGRLDEDKGVLRFYRYSTRVLGERWSYDDPSSPIVVMGTSFTQPSYGLTDGLLRELGFRTAPTLNHKFLRRARTV